MLAISRILFPFELPITTNIYWSDSISRAISSFLNPRFLFGGQKYSFWSIALFLWFSVFIILLLRFFLKSRNFYYFIRKNGKEPDPDEASYLLMKQLLQAEKGKSDIRLLSLSGVTIPMVYRHNFKYWILLPEKLRLSKKELSIVLKHELFHIRHHDLTLKTLTHIVSIFYWWNPIGYFLKRRIDLLLEMRVDYTLAHSSKDKLSYLECLLKVAENSRTFISTPATIALCSTDRSAIVKRFELLTCEAQKKPGLKNKLSKLLPALFCAIVYIASFFFVIEADYTPPNIYEKYLVPSVENTYFVQNTNGTYDVFINNTFIENTATLEHYPDGCKIYQK